MRYRFLFEQMVRRELRQKYKGSSLGVLWYLVNPLILEEDAHVQEWARKRLDIKPGITGLWQVLGRSDIPFDEMTKLDYVYVTNWSLREDIRLILLTVPALLRPRRAF